MKKKQVIIRADGNKEIGYGHVFRCLALAQMLNKDFECWFYIQKPEPFLKAEIEKVVHGLKELPNESNFGKEARQLTQHTLKGDEIVVLDGYQFDLTYQIAIKANGNPLVFIDDLIEQHFVADMVINHAADVQSAEYLAEPYTKFLLGPDYTIVRELFLEKARNNSVDVKTQATSVFLCFGASDAGKKALSNMLQACSNIDAIKSINVVFNPDSNSSEIKNLNKSSKVHLHSNISQEEIVKLIDTSDLAIVPSSTLAYEVCSLKVALATGYFIDNQQYIYKGLMKHGCASGLSNLNNLTKEYMQERIEELIESPGRRQEIVNNQSETFQGKSGQNLLKNFISLC